MARFRRSIFFFRRDLRLEDNMALNHALDVSDQVIPIFVFDPRQASEKNEYFSANAFQFLLESLEELDGQLRESGSRLYCFEGTPPEILGDIVGRHAVEAVFLNRDYTPFSRQRDAAVDSTCQELGIAFIQSDDAMLVPPGLVLNSEGDPYRVFTPFFRNANAEKPQRPNGLEAHSFFSESFPGAFSPTAGRRFLLRDNEEIRVRGGRKNALAILDDIENLVDYARTRDVPSDEVGTSSLSAYLKFGCVSIREVYWRVADALGRDHPLIRQLYWRDFFTHLAWHFPHVFGSAFQEAYNGVRWDTDEKKFGAWCEGRTGFPIVDAGMRQLNKTGWMHNRVRMITASFLTKDLHIDWRLGEKYFARKLVDYDPAVNNGSWQWAASTGADAQPWFRIFNPWLQQKKFDPDAVYIRRWIPELRSLEPKQIHGLERNPIPLLYPAPIVNHHVEREEALHRFKQCRERSATKP